MYRTVRDFMANSTQKQQNLLMKIYKAVQKDHKLSREIQEIDKCTCEEIVYNGDYAFGTGETEDVNSLCMRLKTEQDILRADIKTDMETALQLQMGRLGIIKDNYGIYTGKDISRV